METGFLRMHNASITLLKRCPTINNGSYLFHKISTQELYISWPDLLPSPLLLNLLVQYKRAVEIIQTHLRLKDPQDFM